MKKIIILILICMPLILIMGVSIFGRIINTDRSIPVESVQFLNDSNEPVNNSNYEISVENGETYQLLYRILPASATDKKVSFESSNNSICTVSDSGVVSAHTAGKVEITIKTYNNGHKAKINIGIIVSKMQSVSLVLPELMDINQIINLGSSRVVIIDPPRGVDNRVTFESSNSAVLKIENNILKAVAQGTAVITVASVADPSITDSATITVSDTEAVLWLLSSEITIYDNVIDLSQYVGVNTAVCGDNKPEFIVYNAGTNVTLNGSIATFEQTGMVFFKVKIKDVNDVVHTLEINLLVMYIV